MKKTFFILIVVLIGSKALFANNPISLADSLFVQKKYTESFEIYKGLLEEDRVASAAMLLKMAFIKEGLGGYSDALYYLNLYYLQTADKKVLSKMDELAKKKDIKGYEFSDFEFVQTLFFKYYMPITMILTSMAILLLALSFYLKTKKNIRPVFPSFFMVIVLAILFYVLNFGRDYKKAIINQSNTYLMSGPSAGAEVIKIISKGNRLKTINQQDVWTKVEFENQIGYIKTDKLKYVTF
jgi:hypothetical protein